MSCDYNIKMLAGTSIRQLKVQGESTELGCINFSVVDISVCVENVHLPSGHNREYPLHGSYQFL